MKKKQLTALALFFLLIGNQQHFSQTVKKPVKALADKIVLLKGRISTKAEVGENMIPVPNILVYFQRDDCKRCIVAAQTNGQGEYQLLVSKGKYKFFVYDTDENNRIYDVVSPKQGRLINIQSSGITANIELTLQFKVTNIQLEL